MRRQKLIIPRRNEGPLLVSAPMALATIQKLKTETRRTTGLKEINQYPDQWDFAGFHPHKEDDFASFIDRQSGAPKLVRFPYGRVMDFLWLRENWHTDIALEFTKPSELKKGSPIWYTADGAAPRGFGKMRPSIYLPRWASRARVQLLGIGAQRLHTITEEAAQREGSQRGIFREGPNIERGEVQLELNQHARYLDGFKYLWITINGRPSWELNPWVWMLRYQLEGLYNPARFN